MKMNARLPKLKSSTATTYYTYLLDSMSIIITHTVMHIKLL